MVLLCCHKDDNTLLYAVKVLSKAQLIKECRVDSAFTEKRIHQFVSELGDPFKSSNFNKTSTNFVQLFKTFMNEKHLFFVMEYCPGGDLYSRYCDSETLTTEETVFYAANIVLILEKLFEIGVIHRDIKSENFLISEDGYLKLSDFGDSKDNMHFRGRAYTLVGTNQFMAPEVVE